MLCLLVWSGAVPEVHSLVSCLFRFFGYRSSCNERQCATTSFNSGTRSTGMITVLCTMPLACIFSVYLRKRSALVSGAMIPTSFSFFFVSHPSRDYASKFRLKFYWDANTDASQPSIVLTVLISPHSFSVSPERRQDA